MILEELIKNTVNALMDIEMKRNRELSIANLTKLVALEEIKASNNGKTDIEVTDKKLEEETKKLSNDNNFKSYIKNTTADQMSKDAENGNTYKSWKTFEHKEKLRKDPEYKAAVEKEAKNTALRQAVEDEKTFAKLSPNKKAEAISQYVQSFLPEEDRGTFVHNINTQAGAVTLNEIVVTSESAKECLEIINNKNEKGVQSILFGGIDGVKQLNEKQALAASEAFAIERGNVLEDRKIKAADTDELTARRESVYDRIEESDLAKAIIMSKASQAKGILKELDEADSLKAQGRDKDKENSPTYKEMRASLEALAALDDPEKIKSVASGTIKVNDILNRIDEAGKNYEKEHTGIMNLFRNNSGYGKDRLDISKGLGSFVEEAKNDIKPYEKKMLDPAKEKEFIATADKFNNEIRSRGNGNAEAAANKAEKPAANNDAKLREELKGMENIKITDEELKAFLADDVQEKPKKSKAKKEEPKKNEPKKEAPKKEEPKKEEPPKKKEKFRDVPAEREQKCRDKAEKSNGIEKFAANEAANQLYIVKDYANALISGQDIDKGFEKDFHYALAACMLHDFGSSPTGKGILNTLQETGVKTSDDYRKAVTQIAESNAFKKAIPNPVQLNDLDRMLANGEMGATLGAAFAKNKSIEAKQNLAEKNNANVKAEQNVLEEQPKVNENQNQAKPKVMG